MANSPGDRTTSLVRAEMPELSNEVRPLRESQVPSTLASTLVPIVDKIRQLNTAFGLRPYRVFIVHTIWSGGTRGGGQEVETARIEILPTPRVRSMESLPEILRVTGLTEEGSITIDQISAKYSEDDLVGRAPDMRDPAKPVTSRSTAEFYWEVREQRPTDPKPRTRRFFPNGAPNLSRDGCQWSVSLVRQDEGGGKME